MEFTSDLPSNAQTAGINSSMLLGMAPKVFPPVPQPKSPSRDQLQLDKFMRLVSLIGVSKNLLITPETNVAST